ncbi:NAD-dependent deacetylase [Trypanosoma grayi]|uniref:NAD-dependent deacetylase n=1 Tax=Trypanosoma grayi TaxID=71804 RepID=UPI0004F48156|nr:NAD-dependent deacetylase [Trypanosoma grayi]KEG13554.1 NAD-dependent deacetylase [Trypanosoma grayi]
MMSQCRLLAILTGAGISAESGIPTFRSKDGLWENHRVEDVACPSAFVRDPQLVQRFYNARRRALLAPGVAPNPAHLALAKLQRDYRKGRVVVITQNIDNLHERAGSAAVLHMHGELLKVRCTVTGKVFDWTKDVVHGEDRCTCCSALETLRPHIVWFGEMPLYMDEIAAVMENADLFVAIGTSGNVYPAAGLAMQAKANGAKTLELNLEPGENRSDFDESVYGEASVIVPKWVEKVLQTSV